MHQHEAHCSFHQKNEAEAIRLQNYDGQRLMAHPCDIGVVLHSGFPSCVVAVVSMVTVSYIALVV